MLSASGLLDGDGQSALFAVALALALVFDGRSASAQWRIRWPLAIPLILYGLWTVAIAWAAMSQGFWSADTLIITLGGILLLGSPLAFRLLRTREELIAGGSTFLDIAALVLAVAAVLNPLLVGPEASPGERLLNHERTFIAVLCLCLPLRRFRRLTKTLLVLGLGLTSIAYPAATTVVALIAAVVTVFVLHVPHVLSAGLLIAGLAASAVGLPALERALGTFYTAVGRTDNSSTRTGMWEQAAQVLRDDPIGGGWAGAPITALANINGVIQPTPLHNSILTIGVYGGGVSIVLFVFGVCGVVLGAVLAQGSDRVWVRQWLPALSAAVACVAVNPALEKLDTLAAFCMLLIAGAVYPRPKVVW